jgi:hypothetical protein
MPEYEKAMRPEDITRLFVERSNAPGTRPASPRCTRRTR